MRIVGLTKKTILGIVCAGNNILFGLESVNKQHRAEDLLLVDLCFFIYVSKDSGFDEVSLNTNQLISN